MLPRPKPRSLYPPRPVEPVWYDMRERHYTCGKCGEIGEWRHVLDDKPICYVCLREARYGQYERECKARGYHQTDSVSTSSGSGGWYRDESGQEIIRFEVRVRCKCNAQWTGTMPGKRVGGGITSPDYEPPKRWTLKDGKLLAYEGKA